MTSPGIQGGEGGLQSKASDRCFLRQHRSSVTSPGHLASRCSQGLAITAWAFATVNWSGAKLFATMASEAERDEKQFTVFARAAEQWLSEFNGMGTCRSLAAFGMEMSHSLRCICCSGARAALAE